MIYCKVKYSLLSGALLLIGGISLKAVTPSNSQQKSSSYSRPNIVFILADDLGIECLSAYGGTSHKTPNIDRLATQGMKFENCFSNPFCSPSRASLLTGRYPFKNGLKEVLHSVSQEDIYLSPEQPSFARQLKMAGYATAIVGKWHVSLLHKHNTINDFGFDQYQVWQIFDKEGNKRRRNWTPHFNQNGLLISDQIINRYGPDVNMEFLIDFISVNAKKEQPFLAYFTTCLPHFPWEPTPDSKEQGYRTPNSEHKGDPKYFTDMLKYFDKCMGKIMETIDNLGITNNTVLIFLADNGTDRDLCNNWGDGKVIQGGKGTMTDRGTHVPMMIRWPKHIRAGSTCNDLVDFSDIFPTLCDLAGAQLPDVDLHGRSFMPQLLGKPGNPREWVHVQDKEERHLRNREYILNNKNELRPVVPMWEDPAMANQNKNPEMEQAARKLLQGVFDSLCVDEKMK